MPRFLGFFLTVAIIIFVFWFRRRRQRRREKDGKPASEPDTSADEKPHVGYRQTILGVPKSERKEFRRKDSRAVKRDRRRRGEDREASPGGINPDPVELPDEAALQSLGNGRRATSRASGGEKATEEGGRADAKLLSVSAMRIREWLPELPQPTLPRASSRSTTTTTTPGPSARGAPQSYHGEKAAAPPTLAEIHERLTKADVGGTPPPPAPPSSSSHAEDARWSATTRSSVFTAFSSRSSSGAAYVSYLRPPPLLRRQTRAMDPLPESRPEEPVPGVVPAAPKPAPETGRAVPSEEAGEAPR